MSKFVKLEKIIFMKSHSFAAALLTVTVFCSGLSAAAAPSDGDYREALALYSNGMYERAQSLFGSMPSGPLSDGYEVLCAIKMRSSDYPELMAAYEKSYPSTTLTGTIRFEHARLLFDDGNYQDAATEFSKVPSAAITAKEMPEYIFKCGYCAFSLARNSEAMQFFTLLESLPMSEFTAPGRYLTGVIYYNAEQFAEAEAQFWKASVDPRFTDLTDYYIVDCEFNQKNYAFTVKEGERIFKNVPKVRQERLARMISESYLILGDTDKAREYYDDLSHRDMNRKDYFYAGSVMYSVHDYQGAIDNFTKMPDRSDSLGQVANYHLANAYLRTHDQVSAMQSFDAASAVDFDPEITEDASFNYAKLAFDLNKDTSGFARYIKRYSTKARGDQIYGYMALASLVDRDYVGAVDAYDKIDELTPDMQINYTKANFLRGQQLFEGGSYRDAAPYFKATAYYLPKTDRLHQYSQYWYAESCYRTGDFVNAADTYTQLYNASALDDRTEGTTLAYNVGYSLFKQQDYAQAARWFDTYIASGNLLYREDAMNRRADCDFGRHDYKAAVQSYQNVITEFFTPDDIYPYYKQAISYGLAGDRKRKISTLLHVEDASPKATLYSEAYYELGRAQTEQRNYNDAIRTFAHLRDNTEDNAFKAKALLGLGMVNRNIREYDKSLGYYKQVVSALPGSEYADEAMSAIESIYQTTKQPEKYLEYVEANSLNRGKTDADKEKMYFNTAEQVYLAGNYRQAVPVLLKYLDNYPDGAGRSQAEFYLAESYNAEGDKEKACEMYKAAAASGLVGSSFVEMSGLKYADISYSLERFADAFQGYSDLLSSARMDANKVTARIGMMRSSYRAKEYAQSITSADAVYADKASGADLKREARFIKAKSLLATSKRNEAMSIFSALSAEPSTAEGAESSFMIVQNLYDTGDFDAVDKKVYDFSAKAGDQSYWLARAYIVLADSFCDRGKYDQAKVTYESIRDGYSSEAGSDDISDILNIRLERLQSLMKK